MADFVHIANLPRTHRSSIWMAAHRAGRRVIWENIAFSRKGEPLPDDEHDLGSIWSSEDDLSEFWDRYIALVNPEDTACV